MLLKQCLEIYSLIKNGILVFRGPGAVIASVRTCRAVGATQLLVNMATRTTFWTRRRDRWCRPLQEPSRGPSRGLFHHRHKAV